jgi:hypothetical protein
MSTGKKILTYAFIAVLAFSIGYFAFAGYTYSEGSRTGVLLKFSKKGYMFKTWEGELNLGGMTQEGGAMLNNIWEFSVRSGQDSVISNLKNFEGRRVRLTYKEKMRHFPWQGETNYFVEKAELVN